MSDKAELIKKIGELRSNVCRAITIPSKELGLALDSGVGIETEAYRHGWTEGEVEGIDKVLKLLND